MTHNDYEPIEWGLLARFLAFFVLCAGLGVLGFYGTSMLLKALPEPGILLYPPIAVAILGFPVALLVALYFLHRWHVLKWNVFERRSRGRTELLLALFIMYLIIDAVQYLWR
jgi:hypothetical protein